MNKIVKGCLIGGVLYGVLEFGYIIGKIKTLRSLAICEQWDIKPSELVNGLKESDRLKTKLIGHISEVKESK